MRLPTLVLLLALSTALKLQLTLKEQQTVCFYQMLTAHQKYALETTPLTKGRYEVVIKHMQNNQWTHSVYRDTQEDFQAIRLHKVAKHETLYSYCLVNMQIEPLRLKLSLRFGIELLDLKVVVEESDQERIQREAKWIAKQTDKINQLVQSSFTKRVGRDEYANLMRKKMIGYAVIGLVVLSAISGCFFIQLRKTFKERKLI